MNVCDKMKKKNIHSFVFVCVNVFGYTYKRKFSKTCSLHYLFVTAVTFADSAMSENIFECYININGNCNRA